jgi:hypothetical protein
MKRMFLALTVLLASCTMVYLGQSDDDYSCPTPDLSGLSVDRLAAWCQPGDGNITYETDKQQFGVDDYWQTPEQLLANRKGDCEDVCILFLYLVHKYHSVNGYLLGQISGTDAHMTVVVANLQYFRLLFYWSPKPYRTWSYGQAMWIAENTHGEAWYQKGIAKR